MSSTGGSRHGTRGGSNSAAAIRARGKTALSKLRVLLRRSSNFRQMVSDRAVEQARRLAFARPYLKQAKAEMNDYTDMLLYPFFGSP